MAHRPRQPTQSRCCCRGRRSRTRRRRHSPSCLPNPSLPCSLCRGGRFLREQRQVRRPGRRLSGAINSVMPKSSGPEHGQPRRPDSCRPKSLAEFQTASHTQSRHGPPFRMRSATQGTRASRSRSILHTAHRSARPDRRRTDGRDQNSIHQNSALLTGVQPNPRRTKGRDQNSIQKSSALRTAVCSRPALHENPQPEPYAPEQHAAHRGCAARLAVREKPSARTSCTRTTTRRCTKPATARNRDMRRRRLVSCAGNEMPTRPADPKRAATACGTVPSNATESHSKRNETIMRRTRHPGPSPQPVAPAADPSASI